MNAGRLNTRISVNRFTKVADDFGGYTSTEAVLKNVWCHLKEIKGDVSAGKWNDPKKGHRRVDIA
jgi:head-tail adaptor